MLTKYITNKKGKPTHVIISINDYKRIKDYFNNDEFDIKDTYPIQNAVAMKDWNNNDMDKYKDL